MLKQRRPAVVLLSALVTASLLLGACGGGDDNGGDNGGGAAATATLVATSASQGAASGGQTATPAGQSGAATSTAGTQNDVVSDTVAAAGASGTITNGAGTGAADVAVITSTQLLTGTQVTTDVTVSTDTAVIEQQLITTVITNTDVVSNVVQSNDSNTTSETAVITDQAQLTPESSTGQAVANVTITPLAPTATPTIVVQATRVVTATTVVTHSVDVTAVATPQPGQSQGQATGAVAQGAGTTFTGVTDAQGKTMLASTLLDSNFQTSDGEVSGEVQDALVDMQTSQILYVMLEYGGVMDLGDNDIPVPLNAFTLKQDGELLLNIPPEHLKQFPDVGNDWPQAGNANWDTDVRNFWSKEGFPVGFDAATSGNRIRRVSDLLTGPTGDAGMGAGTVQDMIIPLDQGRVAYALVSFDGAGAAGGTGAGAATTPSANGTGAAAGTGAGGDWYAIPLSAFDPQNTDNGLAFRSNFNGSLLQNAPRFNIANAGQDRFLQGNYDQNWQGYWNKLTNP